MWAKLESLVEGARLLSAELGVGHDKPSLSESPQIRLRIVEDRSRWICRL